MKRYVAAAAALLLIGGACSRETAAPPELQESPLTEVAAPAPVAEEDAAVEAVEAVEAPPMPELPPVPDAPVDVTERIDLFEDDNLYQWVLFLPEEKGADPSEVWSISAGVAHCTGTPNGYMRTRIPYQNYRFTVEWRWPGAGGNSGVLLHVQEPDEVWPHSIEAQLQHENAGDFWVIGGSSFAEHVNPASRRVEKRNISTERPLGEWNEMIVECRENTIHVYVNEALQNVATEATLSGGFVGLQSEGTPIEFRRARLDPL